MSLLSVVIPAIDEAASLPPLLHQLRGQRGVELELILADGGSRDGTRRLARELGARVVDAPAGRGRQMNRGAAAARGDWLLFLHADSGLVEAEQLARALAALRRRIARVGHDRVAGHFRLRFRRQQQGSDLAYRYYEEKSALNRPECTNGDQGMLLSHRFFDRLGGFDEGLWFLEDQRLAETIRSRGEWITLPGHLTTSARRFEREGLRNRMILSALIMNFHAIGMEAFFHRAATVYRNQGDTGRLRLTPLFRLVDDLNREAGPAEARRRWLATGRYLRSHAWQPFFWLDVALQPLFRGRHPLLWSYDRLFGRLPAPPPLDWAAAALAWLWFRTSARVFRRAEGEESG